MTACAALLAGCSGSDSPAPGITGGSGPSTGSVEQSTGSVGQSTVTTAPTEVLAGTFRMTSVSDPELLAAAPVTITFADGQLSVDGGCNQLFGELKMADSTFSSPQMGMTTVSCDPALMDQDVWLRAFFDEPVGYQLEAGTLTLTQKDVTVVLTAAQDVASPLDGTTWTLTGLNNGDSMSTVPDGVKASLLISGGNATVKTGCNTGTGSATVTDSQLTLRLGVTQIGCKPEVMAVEQQVLSVLGKTADYRINGTELTISSGPLGLVFQATDAPVPTETDPPGSTDTTGTEEPPAAGTATTNAPGTGAKLSGRSWVLTRIVDGDTTSKVPGGVDARISISDGRISIDARCNSIGGDVTVTDSQLTVSNIIMTMMACAGDEGVVENAMLNVFRSADNSDNVLDYVIKGGKLTITGPGGGLVFTSEKPAETAGIGPDKSTQPLPTN